MATIDIKLSQSTVDKLSQLPDGGGNNLSTIFGQIVETNASISETFDWSNSWRISGNNVILKFTDINNRTIANLTYTGEIIPDYYGSSSGTAIASARVLNAPEYFKESVYGTLEYRYYAPSYLTYTSTFTNVERYELQSYVSDPDYGFSTFSLSGDIDINSSSGAVSGSISSLTAKATKIGTSVISGNFAVSSNTAAPESSSVTGTMTQYRTAYLDGSYTNISGNFSVEADTQLDETSFTDAANWSGDDVINVSLPATLHSDYIINSGNGVDVITAKGGGGRLIINSGDGNDEITINDLAPVINGGNGIDTLKVSFGSVSLASYTNLENLILTGTGNINGTGNALDNTITGNKGANRLFGGLGNDTIYGGEGNDYMEHVNEDGDPGTDSFYGGKGNDMYVVDALGATIYENLNEGTDIVHTQLAGYTLGDNIENLYYDADQYAVDFTGSGNSLNNWIRSTAGNDVLYGLDGIDKIEGGAGNDTLDGGTGADTLIGGVGDDIYVVDNIKDVTTEAVSAGTDEVRSSIAWTLGNNLENLTLTGVGNINGTGNLLNNTITGNEGSNTLNGGAGNDTLYGEAGVDTLIGGLGNDTLYGGEGNDVYLMDATADTIIEYSNEGVDEVRSGITFSIANFDNLENLILTGTGNINGTGNALDNTITGNKGANRLFGGLGNDTIYGGEGNDYMEHVNEDGDPGTDSFYGGKGNDMYVVDALGATIYENLNEGTDIVHTQLAGYTLGDNIENLYYDADQYAVDFTGSGNSLNNWIRSTAGNDVLYGLDGIDKIEGGAGNDTLDGGTGADTLIGGVGDDIYVVDNIKDVTTEAVSAGTDEVRSSIAWTLGNNLENLTLTGVGNINGTGNLLNNTITGNEGSNTLNGGAGNDTLYGEAGVDTLIGGLGNDMFTGGDGSDTFFFNSAISVSTENIDTITDFTSGDQIQLSKAIFSGLTKGAVTDLQFYQGEAAHDASDRVIYNQSTGALFYDADGTGAKAAVQIAIIGSTEHPALQATDLWVV